MVEPENSRHVQQLTRCKRAGVAASSEVLQRCAVSRRSWRGGAPLKRSVTRGSAAEGVRNEDEMRRGQVWTYLGWIGNAFGRPPRISASGG